MRPSHTLSRSVMERGFHALGALRNQVLARDLAGPAPMIEESRTGAAVRELCASHPAIPSFAVVEAGAKSSASSNAKPLWLDVYNRRPIGPLVTREAMVVEARPRSKGLIAFRYPQAISSGFAVVEHERYLGIGTMTSLLEKTVHLAHRRAIELEEARRKAEIAREAKSRSLAIMSHELRTPLNAIIGFAVFLLLREVEQVPTEQRRGYITDIRNSARICCTHQRYSRLFEARCRSPVAQRDGVRSAPVPE